MRPPLLPVVLALCCCSCGGILRRCPSVCVCSEERAQVICDRGAMVDPIPTADMDAEYVQELRISAPSTGPPNTLTIGPIFQHFRQLRTLVVVRSAVPAVGIRSFLGLVGLQELNLTDNCISHLVEDNFWSLSRLVVLHLDRNLIESVPSGTFRHASALRVLTLSHNKVVRLEPRVFLGLSSLLQLDVSENPLQELRPSVFLDLQISIQEVYNYTYRTIIKANSAGGDVETLVGLQHFRCRGCLLSTPADLPVLPSVKTLDLGDNLLIQLPPAAEFWPRLVVLLVDGNRLSSLPDLPAQLAELSLASNNFTRIQFDKLRRVRSLDLSDNRLLTSDVLTMLEKCDLLQDLSLANCGLLHLKELKQRLRLRSLNLTHNPWDCSQCNVTPFLLFLGSVRLYGANCASPHQIKGKSLQSFKHIEDFPECRSVVLGGFVLPVVIATVLIFITVCLIVLTFLYRHHYAAHYYTREECHLPELSAILDSTEAGLDDYDISFPLVSGNKLHISSIERATMP